LTQNGTPPVSGDQVSRARFDRERAARREAEALLEIKSREIYDANAALRAETEALRGALARLEESRQSEARARRESGVLFAALDAMAATQSGTMAVQGLLSAIRDGLAADAAVLLRHEDGEVLAIAATDPTLVGRKCPHAEPGLHGPYLNVDDRTMDTAEPGCVIAVPFHLPEEGELAIACVAGTAGRLGEEELRILSRVAEVAAAPLEAARLGRRNALLAALIEGTPFEPSADSVLDAPLNAVTRAFDQLTTAQAQVVRVVSDVLGAPPDATDTSVSEALATIGGILKLDLVAVVEHGADGGHMPRGVWRAADVPDRPDVLLAAHVCDSECALSREDVATDPDLADRMAAAGVQGLVAVPLHIPGGTPCTVIGCTFDRPLALAAGLLPLFRAVAVSVASVLAQRDGTVALNDERNRLQATLAAMPDLLLEIDRDGVFRDFHSGRIAVPDAIHYAFQYRLIEEVLPPELATQARRIMAIVDAGERSPPFTFPFDMGNGERIFDLTATRMGETGYLFVMRDVTEARRQQAVIERLSEVARRTTNLVIVTDAQQRIEWANPAFEALTGYSLSSVIGRRPGEIVQGPGTDKAEVRRIAKALAARQAVRAELLNYSRTGEEYWVDLDIQPLMTADGELRGYMAVETDVTERRRQAERLRETGAEAVAARQLLVAAVESLEDAFVLYDADDRLILCNDRYRETYPLAAPAIVPGARFEDVLRYGLERGEYAEAVGREEEWLAKRLAQHRQEYSMLEQQLSDGRWLRIIERATPDGGRVGLRVDITALKLAERRALADRAEAMEASRDGIAILDADRRFLYANAAFRREFAIGAEEDMSTIAWDTLFRPAIAAWVAAEVLPRMLADGSWQGELEGLSRDGQIVDQEMTLTLKSDGGVLVISRDVSRRRIEAAERARLDEDLRLAQRREAMAHIAAGLAHDFNNLLATIDGCAALIADDMAPGDPALPSVQRIIKASAQSAALVRRLLSLGARTRAPRRFDLRDPVREAADLARAAIRAPARLAVHVSDLPCPVEADPTDVMQVVLNLVINARDALEGGDGTIDVNVDRAQDSDLAGPFAIGSVDPDRTWYRLEVRDSGTGMTAERAAKVFQPYFSTKGAAGTGLGLAVVATVVLGLGGAVRLETAPGEGTRFIVLWPDRAAEATLPPEGDVPAVTTGQMVLPRLDGRAILVVDDDEAVLSIHARTLEQAGAEVAPTTSPADVIEAIRDDPAAWDAVMTDFDMPGTDGAQLAAQIAAIAPDLPVILVTALPGWQGRSAGGGNPFAAVIGKPAQRVALVSAVAAAIESRSRDR
jgi:PAS domain S-box-containing protein